MSAASERRTEDWQNPTSLRGLSVGVFQDGFMDLAGLQSLVCHLVGKSQPSAAALGKGEPPLGTPFPDYKGPRPVKFQSCQEEEVSQ